MEKVVLLNNWKHIKDKLSGMGRIYFGSEFCDYILPSPKDVDRLIKMRKDTNIAFSIVTPYLNQRRLTQLTKLLIFINVHTPEIEVIVNDWGVLHMLYTRFPRLQAVLGRVLSRQKRGPFVKVRSEFVQIEKLGLKKTDQIYLKSSILQNDHIVRLAKEYKIKRIGLDNTRQGIIFENKGFSIDLYYPYIYITTSNYCMTEMIERKRELFVKTDACRRFCFNSGLNKIKIGEEWVYLFGNTQFYPNDTTSMRGIPKYVNRLIKVSF
ncbi:MAG: hypothetical protein AUJ74_00370 [Candidatus Omnitrophica bacterium CG1_02_44_16]|nr:MAG: hypothetical protein AUJ74_00370 [Candidatus Omnitrophica bacterium CG1_02_44_16]PIY83076.1 MAG: hypothetical protein COY78_03810 [Candidatus Omnitrophica bacterium CG_4_10_14_0_8_um_filter_44_12]PIZ83403.1 MAG: hypothetical protein COX96_08230 [Candidatus Omnitrophica bacterium CG_4_10_14_0_2_um_filter_44_9]